MMGSRCCLLPTSSKDEQYVLEKRERKRERTVIGNSLPACSLSSQLKPCVTKYSNGVHTHTQTANLSKVVASRKRHVMSPLAITTTG